MPNIKNIDRPISVIAFGQRRTARFACAAHKHDDFGFDSLVFPEAYDSDFAFELTSGFPKPRSVRK